MTVNASKNTAGFEKKAAGLLKRHITLTEKQYCNLSGPSTRRECRCLPATGNLLPELPEIHIEQVFGSRKRRQIAPKHSLFLLL